MSERTTGLILRTRLLTETSLIVQWLTADFGRFSTVAKGARSPKSPFSGKLDLFYLAEFNFIRSRRSDLHTLCELSLLQTHATLRRNLPSLQQAAYCAALIEHATEPEAPIPGIFHLFKNVLAWLATAPPQPRTIFAFELRFLRELGLEPDLANTRLSAPAKHLLKSMLDTDWPALAQLKPAQRQIVELRQFLHSFLNYHLEKLPPTRNAALKAA